MLKLKQQKTKFRFQVIILHNDCGVDWVRFLWFITALL